MFLQGQNRENEFTVGLPQGKRIWKESRWGSDTHYLLVTAEPKEKHRSSFPLSLPPTPTLKLAGAFVIRVGFVASFSNPFSTMHESAMRVRPSSCPFEKEVRRVGFPNALAWGLPTL